MNIIKSFPNGNGRKKPVLFLRKGDKVAYAWGYKRREVKRVPEENQKTLEQGVIWCPNFYEAMVKWAQHRESLTEKAKGRKSA